MNSKTNDDAVTLLLVEKLFVLRNATFSHHAEEAVNVVFKLVDQHDDKFIKLCMSLKTMETIIRAMKRPFASRHFLHLVGGVLFCLVRESEDRSAHFVACGGLDCCLTILQTRESDAFLMKAYLALVAMLLDSMETKHIVVGQIFDKVVAVMELHETDAELYEFGCHVLKNCLVCSVDSEWYNRAVQCIYNGLIRHGDTEVQSLGKSLLEVAVGPQYAKEMERKLYAWSCDSR